MNEYLYDILIIFIEMLVAFTLIVFYTIIILNKDNKN